MTSSVGTQGFAYIRRAALDRHSALRLPIVIALAALICLAHGVFELTFDKKAGIPFLREITLVALVLTSTLFLMKHPQLLRFKLSALVLFYCVAFIALSALFSWWWFSQPPQYALLEERRVLGMLWFFPALWLMLKLRPTAYEITQAYFCAGALLILYSLLYYTGVLADNKIPADLFIEQHFYADDDPRNLTRYVLGTSLLTVVIPLSVATIGDSAHRSQRLWIGAILGGAVFTLLAIDQSRSALISIAAISFLVLLAQARGYWKPLLLSAGVLAALATGALVLSIGNEKVQWLLDSLLNGQGVRSQTSQIIWRVLSDSWFWGHGALSVQYQRGFLDIYNENFWLNDIGKLGLLYRFGFLTLLFATFYIYVLWFFYRAKQVRPQLPLLRVFALVYLLTLLAPWGSVVALLPVELGIALGLVINDENSAPG